jgi:hypothetical protein
MSLLRRLSRLARTEWRRYAFCTIATSDFLPWALVLFESIHRHHPSAQCVLLYVHAEGEPRALPVIEGVEVIGTSAVVDADREADLRRRFNVAELCFALKPALLAHCLRKHARHAVYLDSDVDVLAPLDAMDDALGAHCVLLTPHLDTAIPIDGKLPSDLTILRAGACNLGFVAIRDEPESHEVLAWWSERIARWGYVAPEHGYQGDQKWMDLAPALFPCVGYLRDRGSNVAAWNLHSRTVRVVAGKPAVDDAPLAFFHFSGFDPDRPDVLSKYQNRIRLPEVPAVAELARAFARRVVAAREAASRLAWTEAVVAPAKPVGPSTYAAGALADADYRARFEAQAPTGAFASGEAVVLPVRVTNVSAGPWPVARSPDGAGGIALSWHMRDADGVMVSWENARHFLPRDLAPGESVDLLPAIRLPQRTGVFTVEFDLVHEGVAWFSHRGNHGERVSFHVGLFEGPPG